MKCIEDEIPFEVPEGWAWARISTVCLVNPRNALNDSLQVSFISMPLIQEGFANNHTAEIKEWSKVKSGFTHFAEGDVAVAKITPCFENRKSVIFLNLKNGYGAGTTELHVLRAINILPEYILWIVKSEDFISKGVQAFTGAVGQQRVGKDYISNYMVPIPPLAEQKYIVDKINEMFGFISSIEKNKTALQDFIKQTKSKILNLAIRGQLVPQNPDDEPASVLLEHIRAEKEKLIKQGKLKRDKKESFIFRGDDNSYYEKIGDEIRCIDEELPFEIPDSWEWVRLENCCCKEIRRGKSPKYIEQSETLVFAQKCNTKYNGIDIGLAFYLDESTLNKYLEDEYMQDGDIVINSTGTGTLGRVGFYRATDNHNSIPIVPDSHVTVIRSCRELDAFYLYAFMKANQSELEKKGEGSTNQKELKPLTLKELYVPVPPYEEQLRIAVSINNAFSLISKLEKSLK